MKTLTEHASQRSAASLIRANQKFAKVDKFVSQITAVDVMPNALTMAWHKTVQLFLLHPTVPEASAITRKESAK